jgi:hypothetical protein
MTVQALSPTKEIYHILHLFARSPEIQTFEREGQKPGGGGEGGQASMRCAGLHFRTVSDGGRAPMALLSKVLCICI